MPIQQTASAFFGIAAYRYIKIATLLIIRLGGPTAIVGRVQCLPEGSH
jgi:hypothetical protein